MSLSVKIAILLTSIATSCFAGEVLEVSSSKHYIAISQSSASHFNVGEFICVIEKETDSACGFVTVANTYGAIMNLQFRKAEIVKGQKVGYPIESRPTADFPEKADPPNVEESSALYHALFDQEVMSVMESEKRAAGSAYNFTTGLRFANMFAQLETAIEPRVSLGVQIGMGTFSKLNTNTSSSLQGTLTGFLLTVNYYFEDMFKGLWVTAGGGYYLGKTTYLGRTDDPAVPSVIGTVGYRWLTNHFNFGASVGAQYFSINKTAALPYDIKVLSPILAVDFGWVF